MPSVYLKDGKVLLKDGKVAVSEACCHCFEAYWVVYIRFDAHSGCWESDEGSSCYDPEWSDPDIANLGESLKATAPKEDSSNDEKYEIDLEEVMTGPLAMDKRYSKMYLGYTCIPKDETVPDYWTVRINGQDVQVRVYHEVQTPLQECPDMLPPDPASSDPPTYENITHYGNGEYRFPTKSVRVTPSVECGGPYPEYFTISKACVCCNSRRIYSSYHESNEVRIPSSQECELSVEDFSYDGEYPNLSLELEEVSEGEYTLHIYNKYSIQFRASVDWCPCCHIDPETGLPTCPDTIDAEFRIVVYEDSARRHVKDRGTTQTVTLHIAQYACPWYGGSPTGPTGSQSGLEVGSIDGWTSDCIEVCAPPGAAYDVVFRHPCDDDSSYTFEGSYNLTTTELTPEQLEEYKGCSKLLDVGIRIQDSYRLVVPCCDGGYGIVVSDACGLDPLHDLDDDCVVGEWTPVQNHGGITLSNGMAIPDYWAEAWWFACGRDYCRPDDSSVQSAYNVDVIKVCCEDRSDRCHYASEVFVRTKLDLSITVYILDYESAVRCNAYIPETLTVNIGCPGNTEEVYLSRSGSVYSYSGNVQQTKYNFRHFCCTYPVATASSDYGWVVPHMPPVEGDVSGTLDVQVDSSQRLLNRWTATGYFNSNTSYWTVHISLDGTSSFTLSGYDIPAPTNGSIEVQGLYGCSGDTSYGYTCGVEMTPSTPGGYVSGCGENPPNISWTAHDLDRYLVTETGRYVMDRDIYITLHLVVDPNLPELVVDTSGGGWSPPPSGRSMGPARIMSAPSGYTEGTYRTKAPADTPLTEPSFGRTGARDMRYANGASFPSRMPAAGASLKIEWQYAYLIHVETECKCDPDICYTSAPDTTGTISGIEGGEQEIEFIAYDERCPGKTYWEATGFVWVTEDNVGWTFAGPTDTDGNGSWSDTEGTVDDPQGDIRANGECYYQWISYSIPWDGLHPGTIDVSPVWDIDDPEDYGGGGMCVSPPGIVFKVTINPVKGQNEFYTLPMTMFGSERRRSYSHGTPDRPGTAAIYPCGTDRTDAAIGRIDGSFGVPHCLINTCPINARFLGEDECLEVSVETVGMQIPGVSDRLQQIPTYWIEVYPFVFNLCETVEQCPSYELEEDGYYHPHKSCVTVVRSGCLWAVHIVPYIRVHHLDAYHKITFVTRSGGVGCDPEDFQHEYIFPEDQDFSGYSFPEPECDCYNFVGWDRTLPQTLDQDYTLTAQWTPKTFTISYDLDGGRWGSDAHPSYSYTCSALPISIPQPIACSKFKYWTDQDGTAFYGTVPAGTTGNKTFTAVYSDVEETFTISYDLDGGVGPTGAVNPISFTGSDLPVFIQDPTKDCYTFDGWTSGGSAFAPPIEECGDYSLKANWIGNQVTVPVVCRLYCDSTLRREESHPPVDGRYGEETTKVYAPDYSQDGYSLDSMDHSPKTIVPECGMTNEIVFTYRCNDYTLSFDCNYPGCTNPMSVVRHFGDDIRMDYSYAAGQMSRPCYNFDGWTVANQIPPNNVPPDYMPNSNLHVVAQWSIMRFTVSFYDYDGTFIASYTVDCGTEWANVPKPQNPTRYADQYYCYSFTGWDYYYPDVTSDVSAYAQYSTTPVVCHVSMGGNDVYFCDLQDALLYDAGGWIVLDASIGTPSAYVISSYKSVDLNGHTISRQSGGGSSSGHGVFDVTTGGTLEIYDSSGYGGSIIGDEYGVYVDGGAFYAGIRDVGITQSEVTYTGSLYAVFVASGGAYLYLGYFGSPIGKSASEILSACGGKYFGYNPCTIPSKGCGSYSAACGGCGAFHDSSTNVYEVYGFGSYAGSYNYSVDGILKASFGDVEDAIPNPVPAGGVFVESTDSSTDMDLTGDGYVVSSRGTCSNSAGSAWYWCEVTGYTPPSPTGPTATTSDFHEIGPLGPPEEG